MRSVAWGKLLLNLNNAINALSGRTLLEELAERDYRRVLAAAMLETLNLLNAAGIEPAKIGPFPPRLLPHAVGSPNFIFKNLFLRIQRIDPAARSSMWDDFVAERPTEIDYLNGEVVKLAKALGREAPVNRAIVELVKERQFGIERAWAPEELKRHVFRDHGVTRLFGY
jgi:2-dehydropantoate 2-reductase